MYILASGTSMLKCVRIFGPKGEFLFDNLVLHKIISKKLRGQFDEKSLPRGVR